jgi:RimJ/RimL family protein N-acetyltransferase
MTHPVTLSSALLRLDQPTASDAGRMFEYCQDPAFERYLTVPWPYRREHAESFICEYIPGAWASGSEVTWALRGPDSAELLGVISLRLPSGSIGFWLGAEHRGHGYMQEAQRLVADWAFGNGIVESIHWECLRGNLASARTARKAGFEFTGEAPSVARFRDGSHPPSWQAWLHAADSREAKPGWPEAVSPA